MIYENVFIVAAVATTKVLCISRKLQYHVASGKGLVSLPRLWHLARFARTDRVCLPRPKIDQTGFCEIKILQVQCRGNQIVAFKLLISIAGCIPIVLFIYWFYLICCNIPRSLVTSSVAAPAISPNIHFVVQSATADTNTLGRELNFH